MSDDLPKKRIKKTGKRKKKNSSNGQWLLIAGAVVAMVLVAGLGIWWFVQKSGVPGSSQAKSDTEQSPASAVHMVKYEHPAGVYSCELPGMPALVPQKKDPTIDARVFKKGDETGGYVLKYYPVPQHISVGKTGPQILSVTVANAGQGKIKSDEIFSQIDGHEAVTYRLKTPDNITIAARTFLHHDAIFEFMVMFDGEEIPGEADRFFQSIHLAP